MSGLLAGSPPRRPARGVLAGVEGQRLPLDERLPAYLTLTMVAGARLKWPGWLGCIPPYPHPYRRMLVRRYGEVPSRAHSLRCGSLGSDMDT